MKAPIKLLALDIDGTVVDKDYRLSEEVIRAVKKVSETTDIKVMIASGRMPQAAIPIAKALGSNVPVVVYQGAMVYDFITDDILFHQPIPPELAVQVANDIESFGIHVNLYLKDDLCMKKLSEIAKKYSSYRFVEPKLVDSYDIVYNIPTTKITGLEEDTEKVKKVVSFLSEKYKESLHIVSSCPTFVEVVNNQVNKGKTVINFAKSYFNINPENIMAIGDADNDYEMLQLAGYSVAMGNATDKAKSVASYITKTVEEYGVKHAIEKFILQEV